MQFKLKIMKKYHKNHGLILALFVFGFCSSCSFSVNSESNYSSYNQNRSNDVNKSIVKNYDSFVESTLKPKLENESQTETFVHPGYGTEDVYLGISREDLLKILGKPSDEYTHDGHCSYTEMHWYPKANADGAVNGDGIFAFLRDDKLFEIRFGKGYYTKESINYNLSLKELMTKIDAPLYLLSPSANTATNDKDLIYMVEKENGIAYELGVGYKTKKRGINAIYVFYSSNDFLPWGCISENQSFNQIGKETVKDKEE